MWNHQSHTGAGAVHNHFLSAAKTKREILHSYRQRSKGNEKKNYFKVIIIIFPCGFFFRPFLSSIGIPFYIYAHTRCATKRDLGWRPTEAIMGHRWNRLPVSPSRTRMECGQVSAENRYRQLMLNADTPKNISYIYHHITRAPGCRQASC